MRRIIATGIISALGISVMAQHNPRLDRVEPGPGHEELNRRTQVRPQRVRDYAAFYPAAPMDAVADDFHGTTVADPFRWLEDLDSARTQEFIAGQAELYETFLSDTKELREPFAARLRELLDFARVESFWKTGEWFYLTHNDGLSAQSKFYRQRGPRGERELLFDPATLSPDATVAVASWHPNKDGSLIALQVTDGGSDWRIIRLLDTESGEFLPETLRHCRFTSISWMPDGSGFYYNRVPRQELMSSNPEEEYSLVCFHRPGTEQDADPIIFDGKDDPNWSWGAHVTEDGRYLLLSAWKADEVGQKTLWTDTVNPGGFQPLYEGRDCDLDILGNDGPVFYARFRHEKEVPNGRIVRLNLADPAEDKWTVLLPEQTFPIGEIAMVGDHFVIETNQKVANRLYRLPKDGGDLEQIPTPPAISISSLNGQRSDSSATFIYSSFLEPSVVAAADPTSAGMITVLQQSESPINPSDFVVRQDYCTSKDGTRVPMYIIHRMDLDFGQPQPTLLYGYGGFNLAQMPSFNTYRIAWMEAGGIFVLANIRGGSEFGASWHTAAKLEKRQNAFDDFIAAGEWLIKNGMTSSELLAIEGRSNGGLLTAAVALQRPELFGAVISVVPVADMLRYHKLTIGRYWMKEYGDPANPEHFPFLYAYSPVHNVKKDVQLPPMFISSAELDDRVHPAHSLKLIAALQKNAPVGGIKLLRFEGRAGHNTGKPTDKLIQERAEQLAFLARQLGMTPPKR